MLGSFGCRIITSGSTGFADLLSTRLAGKVLNPSPLDAIFDVFGNLLGDLSYHGNWTRQSLAWLLQQGYSDHD
jgi:hypothetical protein